MASGRTVAADVVAHVDLPGFPTAAMDGWVVAGDGPWEIAGTIDTGFPADSALKAGHAMRIATGGLIPAGAAAVIPWEVARATETTVVAGIPDKVHIRPQGEECVRGEVLARCGDVANPALMGLLAAAGVDEVEVYVPPRVVVLVLGDEVIAHGLPGPGQVRDALGIQLPGWIQALGGEVLDVRSVADDHETLVTELRASVEHADIVIATGGTARGHRDFLRSALQESGCEFLIDGVAVRPGHPMMLARCGTTPVVGLPGNPLSALVAVVTLAAPLLDAWLGRGDRELPKIHMAQAIAPARKELTRLMVGRRELGGFREVTHVSSAMLRGIAHADGWAVVPATGVDAGEVVPWIPLPWITRP
jgi:molybdopterin molybdotransferase